MSGGPVRAAVPAVALGIALAGCGAGAADRPPTTFGLAVPGHDTAESDRVGDLLGCRPALVSAFVKLDSDVTVQDLERLGAGGATPLVTLEPWSWRDRPGEVDDPALALRRITAGAVDDDLRRIADVLAAYDGEVLLRFAHEMNAGWYPWGSGVNGNVPDHYVWAWRHVHRLVAPVAPRVRWLWAPVAAWWPDAAPLRSWWPGEDVVDVVGLTGYARSDLGAATAEDTFGSAVAELTALTDDPVLLAETGASGPGRTRWIRSLGPFLEERPSVVGLVWFNTSPATTGATGDYRVDDDPEAARALADQLDQLDPVCADDVAGSLVTSWRTS